ncbi:esterase-like activity of phytase family protein [Fibrella sp. HMF5335]|uniref:Esterase-like activity of phytase family protein n=1 Tax=Fibrella rubiginis TaxID=2817060 RepID=A0A939GEX2_9BACT|nr:esterase-like activity of phytase family protein [Fibrella rubiginis]MBO0936230.1 esterase-like activity of phytase family protein [Fibrella rubiginis]
MIRSSLRLPIVVCLALACWVSGCQDHRMVPQVGFPAVVDAINPGTFLPAVLTNVNGVQVYNGGFGSAIAADPTDPAVFYMLTDRGPNIDGTLANSKVFALPGFAPQIGKFRLINGQMTLEKVIELKNSTGDKLNGLPNPANQGGTGETALSVGNTNLGTSVDGIDSEGMAIAPDGTFWVSDEYGPHIVHFDATGRTIERINPFGSGTGGRRIPLVFATRRANRGMEGLTITPDGKTLVGIMQFPLYNPSSAAISGSLVTRILTFDIASGSTKQYVYLIERSNLQAISEITAITNTTFLVLERDGEYGTDANKATLFKRVYKIDLSNATDISDPANGANGKLFGGKTVEELKTAAALQTNGIVPVSKSLVLDLATDVSPVYPHDKAEGMTLLSPTLLAVSNDDDFGVTGTGTFVAKLLPATNAVDRNRVYFITLKAPVK